MMDKGMKGGRIMRLDGLTAEAVDYMLSGGLREPRINHEASEYVEKHYKDLLKFICKNGIKEKAEDLLSDVYISLLTSEAEGNGYDFEYQNGRKEYNGMSLAGFVYGRIKAYCKNPKYSSDVISVNYSSITRKQTIELPQYDSFGNPLINSKGRQVVHRVVQNVTEKTVERCYAASFTPSDDLTACNDSFQIAYAMASTVDNTDEIDTALSLSEKIDYCVDVCSLHGVNLVNVLKNIEKLGALLPSSNRRKAENPIFSKLTALVKEHDDFASDLMDILTFARDNRAYFEVVMAQY